MKELEIIIVVSGLAFLFIAFVGGGKLQSRIFSFGTGLLLIATGVAIHTGWIPTNAEKLPTLSPSSSPTSSPMNSTSSPSPTSPPINSTSSPSPTSPPINSTPSPSPTSLVR